MYDFSSNEEATKFISSTDTFPYYGTTLPGLIKSISNVPFENISKVSGTLVSNLGKISGVQNY